MTKVINKKFVAIIMMILFSLCLGTIPVYADAVNVEGTASDSVELIYLGEDDVAKPRTINSVRLRSLGVYAYAVVDGEQHYLAINGEYGYAEGPTYPILNCTVPSTFYQAMGEMGLNYYYNILEFSVDGSNLSRVVLKVDDETIVDTSLTRSGTYTISWISPRTTQSDYELIVYSNNVNVAAWGNITVG